MNQYIIKHPFIYCVIKTGISQFTATTTSTLITNTLGAQTFTGRNFREFREFSAFSRKFMQRNISKKLIRESLCPRKIHNFLFAKVNSAKNQESLNKNELQWLLKLSFSTITTVQFLCIKTSSTKPFDILNFLLFYNNRSIVLCPLSKSCVLMRCVPIK